MKCALNGKTTKMAYLVIVVLLLVTLAFLAINGTGCAARGYSYSVPEQTEDGWETASLREEHMNEDIIVSAMRDLANGDNNPFHSILIVKNDKLVLEKYFPGDDLSIADGLDFVRKDFDTDTLHCLASASKSVTSILVGIAIDKGFVKSTQEKVFSYFPEYSVLDSGSKNDITIEQLLTMSSGIPWDESSPFDDPGNDLAQMVFFSPDPVQYVLAKPLVAPPGATFIYNSGTTNLLGEIVRRSSGLTLAEFAERYLFTPLGITSYQWIGFPKDPRMAVASSLLYLRPRDMAKIGQLYLQDGYWNGEQIVAEKWVEASTKSSIVVPDDQVRIKDADTGYGYQWWLGTFPHGNVFTYYAAGWGGQFIFVLPEKDMVVVFTAGNYGGGYQGFFDVINNQVLAATNSLE